MTAGGGTRGDETVERGAEKLDELARKAAARGGLAGKLSDELADDASFLRKLKPSLVVARAKGRRPPEPARAPVAPSGPQLERPGQQPSQNPFVVVGAALAAGIVVAKLIDWRGHAHPRR